MKRVYLRYHHWIALTLVVTAATGVYSQTYDDRRLLKLCLRVHSGMYICLDEKIYDAKRECLDAAVIYNAKFRAENKDPDLMTALCDRDLRPSH